VGWAGPRSLKNFLPKTVFNGYNHDSDTSTAWKMSGWDEKADLFYFHFEIIS
jgi:hypothetical protein